jgi:signal transduction histidine kinase
MAGIRRQRSLRFRLLAATLLAVLVALALAGLLLSGLFRDHVMRQFSRTLTEQLDQVTARLEFDGTGQPRLGGEQLSDPRWSRPYSGLYWQIDRAGATPLAAVLRSRSLWDTTLQPPADAPAAGEVHVHEVPGPQGAALLLVERTVQPPGAAAPPWRLMVAADLGETAQAIQRFTGMLAASLGALLLLLGAAAVAQVAVGLAPLRALQRSLAGVHAGQAQRIDAHFPAEVQPLVDDFNRVLDHNAAIVARARTQAGNLAHAVKTPLAALAQAASAAQRNPVDAGALAARVHDQVAVARRHVDWHLARARAAAAHGMPGVRAAVAPALAGLVRVLERVHAERGVRITCAAVADDLHFAGEVQDLQEVAGNLIDNACKWARSAVQVQAWGADTPAGRRLHLVIEDDGPGIAPQRRAAVMARGARLDESVPGSGLGLAIVSELVGLYGGTVTLADAATGGLRVEVELPGAPPGH